MALPAGSGKLTDGSHGALQGGPGDSLLPSWEGSGALCFAFLNGKAGQFAPV